MEFKLLKISELRSKSPRSVIDQAKFGELKASIAAIGLIFPVIVTGRSKSYLVIDGALRLKACAELGLAAETKVPALITEDATGRSPGKSLELTLIANSVRENLSVIDQAELINLLVNNGGSKTGEVAAALGKSEEYVRRILRIFKLPRAIIASLREGSLTLAHCHWFTRLSDNPELLEKVYRQVLKEGLAPRDLETLVSGSLPGGGVIPRYSFFAPTVIKTEAGSRMRFEPRRNSIRLELNIIEDDVDTVLKEVRTHLAKLTRRRLSGRARVSEVAAP